MPPSSALPVKLEASGVEEEFQPINLPTQSSDGRARTTHRTESRGRQDRLRELRETRATYFQRFRLPTTEQNAEQALCRAGTSHNGRIAINSLVTMNIARESYPDIEPRRSHAIMHRPTLVRYDCSTTYIHLTYP